ncbi:hypothetical protein [Streptomyces sp. TRM70350]|uniref:hypothetical protein n=1 Tax=Streptomyces sp. TRM70350 TaxID=2856165 RepID=UPI001C475776|nr:hypothetical protein [Streptomyces sp. TRM70350]MBV7700079.1 hypothetical protein [Streptomyces sp. TRM70350]
MSSLKEAITWSGPAVVILFTLGRAESSLGQEEFDVAGTRPDEVEIFPISPEPGGRKAVVREYDLTFHDVDQVAAPYLRQCLRKAAAHAEGIAWLAFEGAFHFDHLFTDDIADQIYGYCVTGEDPVVAWDHATLASDGWKQGIGEVRAVLDRAFPTEETA